MGQTGSQKGAHLSSYISLRRTRWSLIGNMLKKFLTLAISRGMIEIASGMLLTMAAMALVRAVPLLSDTPVRRKV